MYVKHSWAPNCHSAPGEDLMAGRCDNRLIVCLCVCVFVCVSVCKRISGTTRLIFTIVFACYITAVSLCYCGGVAIRCVLPVLSVAS